MKKILFLSALALGLMTSCSEDEQLSLPTVGSNTIAFATQSANMPMTRSGATITSLNKFTVDAVNTDNTTFFANVQYVYDNTQGLFISSTPYYWPTTNKLSFYAISDPGTVSRDANKVPHYAYADWAGEKDLVAATVLAGEKTIPYPLTFQHVLSQVSVSAEAKDKSEQLTYKLTSVEMETPCDGTYSFADATGGIGTWEIDNASNNKYSFADALPLSFNETGSVNSGTIYWNILPVTNGKIKFKVGYQVFQNGKMIAEFSGANTKICEVENPNLASGKRYVYNFLLTRGTENVITFTTDIVDWDSSATVTNKEPYDPTLTYVTYRDGTIRTYDLSGVIESTEESVYLRPTTMIENANDAVEVKIGNQVTEIGYKCFAGCRYLAKVEIPSSVTKLGTYAFSACYSLKDINFPEGLLEIDDKCFAFQNGWYNGAAFSHFNFPSTLTRIGKYAFAGSMFIEEVEIPAGVLVDDNAFWACDKIKSVVINEGCTLGINAFRQNQQMRYNDNIYPAEACLTSVEFKGKVKFSGYAVFHSCPNLTTIKYNSTELPYFPDLEENYNVWTSVTPVSSAGYNTREDGINEFLVPANATYSEEELDYLTSSLFNPENGGFTLKKTL